MSKIFTIEELKALLVIAERNYNNCGCSVYLEEINNLKARIKELEKHG